MSCVTRKHGFPPTYETYPLDQWQGRSGKASWLPAQGPLYYTQGGSAGVPHGGAQWFQPVKPQLMMDPSDPSTWQRPYRFTPQAAMAAAFGSTTGLAFLLSAGVVAEFIAKDVSSPQTTELNAEKRAPTLMKWVHIGMVEAALFVTIAAIIDRQNRAAIIAGGLLSAVITEGQYLHARAAGLANLGTATEDW